MTDNSTSPGSNDPAQTESLSYELDEDERPSEAVVQVVAALTDTSILELEPLYHTIDPENLDRIITGGPDRGTTSERSVSFHFNGCQVTVNQHTVRVESVDD